MKQARGKWTTQEDDVIRTSYPVQGPSAVGAHLGRTPAAVRRRASKLGVKRLRKNMGHVKLDKAQRSKAVLLYTQEKLSGVEIALRLGVKPDCIYDVLRAAGVDRDSAGHRNRKVCAGKVIKLHEDGSKQVDIAEELGVSQSVVSVVLRGAGIKRSVREFTQDEVTEIVKRYEAGEAAVEIAPEFDVFHKRILTILRACGVTIRKTTRVDWTDIQGRAFTFRSKWELWTAQQLDAAGLCWDYELRSYAVLVDGKMRSYIPDFWVWDSEARTVLRSLIDVKGKTCVEQMKKIVLFQEQYPTVPFELWTGGVLRSMGVGVSPSEETPFAVAQRVTSCGGKTYG